MHRLSLALTTALITGLAACAQDIETTGTVTETDPSTLGAATPTVTRVAEGFNTPWGLAFMPDGDILVTELHGNIRIVRDGELLSDPVAGELPVFVRGQGGLLDIVLHPDYEENGWIYLTHSVGTEEANRTAVSRVQIKDDAFTTVETIFEVAQSKNGGGHFGSRLLFLDDGTFLVTIGDGGNPPTRYAGEFIRNFAQDQDTHFGKVLRLNADGSLPLDNPYRDRPDASPELYSMGHRNQQGIAMDPATGRIWATEHGAQGGDELNLIEPGRNYGWPVVTYSDEYGPGERPVSPHQAGEGMTDPVVVWTPSMAPSGLAFYTGDVYPEWQGDLFAGGLRTNGLEGRDGAVFHIDLDDNGAVIGQTRLELGPVRVRDIRQGPDGYLYVLTNTKDNPRDPQGAGGVLWRIEP